MIPLRRCHECHRIGHFQWLDTVLTVIEFQPFAHGLLLIDLPQMEPFGDELRQHSVDTRFVKSGKPVWRFNRVARGVGLHRPRQLMGVSEVIHFFEESKAV